MTVIETTIFPDDISGLHTMEENFEPYGWYAEMRSKNPVYFDPKQQVWSVFLHKDVERVLSDYPLFSNRINRMLSFIPRINDADKTMGFLDPPQHSQRRGLVAKAFAAKSIKNWEPRVTAVTQHLLDQVKDQDEIDLVRDLTDPLPVTVMAELLGVPSSDWSQFKQWSDDIISPRARDSYGDAEAVRAHALKEMFMYMAPIVQHKRNHPSDDIVSDLTMAEYEGDRLSDTDIVKFSIGLLFAGNDTTTQLLANAFYCFLVDAPSVYGELRNDMSLIPRAIEETLRFRSPSQLMLRRVAQDTNVLGPEMKADQAIIAWIGSANRDERQFADADRFDLHRPNSNQHISFGKGPHFCLGAPLARLEVNICLTEFLKRYSRITPAEGWTLNGNVKSGRHIAYLPIRVER